MTDCCIPVVVSACRKAQACCMFRPSDHATAAERLCVAVNVCSMHALHQAPRRAVALDVAKDADRDRCATGSRVLLEAALAELATGQRGQSIAVE